MPPGRRRVVLEADVQRMLSVVFTGRIWPFDSDAAVEYAQIAAIARARGAALATRNVADFEQCGVEIINPWNAPA